MNRQQRRQSGIKMRPKTYTFTEEGLERHIQETFSKEIEKAKKEAMQESVATAMSLLLVIPMEVLMDHYWKKSYAKKIPEFTQHVLDYYSKWENGELDMEQMQKDLWEYGGVRLEVTE